MRERDLKALEFDKVIHLVVELCASEPGRRGELPSCARRSTQSRCSGG